MRVAYFVQSHRAPVQVLRLLATLRRGSPHAPLVVGHCPLAAALDERELDAVDALRFRHARPARRGSWSLLEPYFDAVELLQRAGADYEWLVYLSGQDYPVRPLAESEEELTRSACDGFLTWRPVDAPSQEGRRRQGVLRYYYRYRELPRWGHALRLLRPFNGVQRHFHVQLTYGPRLGLRVRRPPFGPGAVPYCGSQWTTLRRGCAETLLAVARAGGELTRHFTTTLCPDEAFAQTVLVNAPGLRLRNDNLRFVDSAGTRDGHPRTLGAADAERLRSSRCHFARKFDCAGGSAILDWLDTHALAAPSGPG